MNNLLKVININKKYNTLEGEIIALENISFEINENDIISIVGPSGCGKSSILNIISGLDKKYKGTIHKKNNIVIGYMLQEDSLFPWLTVFDNAILGLKIKKIDTKENISYVINLLKKYNLYEFKDSYPSSLSGGMKQRLSLIRTLAIKPDILLLDEPFSALDYQTRLKVCDDVFKIIKEENKTALVVTHDLNEAISVSNKIIILSKRPANIKKIYTIYFKEQIPSKKRLQNKFQEYYNKLIKEFNYE